AGHRTDRPVRHAAGIFIGTTPVSNEDSEPTDRGRRENGGEARLASTPCAKGLLSRLQSAIHVAAHRPHQVSRLLHAELWHSSSDLSWAQTAPRTGPSRGRAESLSQRL